MIKVITINTQKTFGKLAFVINLVDQKLLQLLPWNRSVQKVVFSSSIFLVPLLFLLPVFWIVKFGTRLEALGSTVICRSLQVAICFSPLIWNWYKFWFQVQGDLKLFVLRLVDKYFLSDLDPVWLQVTHNRFIIYDPWILIKRIQTTKHVLHRFIVFIRSVIIASINSCSLIFKYLQNYKFGRNKLLYIASFLADQIKNLWKFVRVL